MRKAEQQLEAYSLTRQRLARVAAILQSGEVLPQSVPEEFMAGRRSLGGSFSDQEHEDMSS